MAEPLSVTGGIGAAIKILSLAAQSYLSIKGGLEAYQLVRRQLLDYQEDFKGSKIRLESWCKAWRIRSADQTSFGIRLWGIEGWAFIERKLSAVDELCEDLIQFLKPFDNNDNDKDIQGYVQKLKEHREKAKRSTRKRLVKETPLGIQAKAEFLASLPEDRRGALEQRRDHQKAIAEVTGAMVKLDLITGTSEKAGQKATALKECLDILDAISLSLFFSRYPDVQRSASVNERVEAVEKRHHQKILEHAQKLRDAARILYQTCSSRCIDDTRLAIELTDPKDLECEISTYRVMYEATSQNCQEFSLRALQSKPPQCDRKTFTDACRAALDNVTYFASPLGMDETQYYALQIFTRQIRLQEQTLAGLLGDIAERTTVDRWSLFPIQQRWGLSHLLAESSLLLLGTSWLSALSSVNLNRLQDDEAPRYLLRTLEADQERCTLLMKLRAWAKMGLIDLECWCVGILLVEVMYGFKVSNVVKSEGRTLLVLADESRIGTDGVEVKGRWGSPYSKAIAHCFKESTQLSKQVKDKEKYHEMLVEFYKVVFLP
jgi:hypothetical protein